MLVESNILARALEFAKNAHAGQYRKFSGKPYVIHPHSVYLRLKKFGVNDTETLVSAILHDTVEDSGITKDQLAKEFGSKVAEYVAWLSNPKSGNKAKHIEHIILTAPIPIVTIKVMDRIDNLSDGRPTEKFLQRYKESSDVIKDALEKRGLKKLYQEYMKSYSKHYLIGPYAL